MQKHLRYIPLSAIVFLVAILSLHGCSTTWETNSIDGPWVASGVHAQECTRTYLPFYAPLPEHVTFWTTANGRWVEAYKIIDSIVRYLEELGYFEKWPKTNAEYNGYVQRLAPFTFHIVATDPTIVVMVPHPFGDPKDGRSISEIVGQPPKQSASTKYMLNYLEYGTSLPYYAGVLWFSPDLRVPPTTFTHRSDNEVRIDHKRIRLVMTKDGDIWKTKRE